MQGPIFTEKLHDLAFSVNDTVILHCKIAGASSPSVVWYRNEELLNDGGRLKVNSINVGCFIMIIYIYPNEKTF